MQVTVLLDDVSSGPQHEMKSIGQNDIRIDIEKLSRRQSLDRAVGSNWHKCGRALHLLKAEHPVRAFHREPTQRIAWHSRAGLTTYLSARESI